MGQDRATTIIQIAGQNTIRRIPTTRMREVRWTADQLKDPTEIARAFATLAQAIDDATMLAKSNVLNSAVLLRGKAFTGGTAQSIQHGLGRAYTGFLCTRALTAAWSGFELALLTGQTADKFIRLQTGTTGTYDILIF